jgi:prepilin-type N-terminal cleavage/methylation domain-containing protein
MKSASIGSPAVSRLRRDTSESQRGFTLLEALVALALILAFAEVLGPHLWQARRIMDGAQSRAAAQILLRSLLDAPFDRTSLARTAGSGDMATRSGETGGLRWQIATEPVPTTSDAADKPRWLPYRVLASVGWGADQSISAETIRLGRPQP